MAINKEHTQKEAKQILDKFAKALEKVENYEDSKNLQAVKIKGKQDFSREHNTESYVERDESERSETNINQINTGFKKRILENAPKKDEDFIIAEKGNWK